MEAHNADGFYFVNAGSNILSSQCRIGYSLQPPGGKNVMNWLYIVVAVLALALLIYLFIALIKPEWF